MIGNFFIAFLAAVIIVWGTISYIELTCTVRETYDLLLQLDQRIKKIEEKLEV